MNLTYYPSPQRLTQRQTRWIVEIMDYDIKLQHKPGKTMIPADALSRRHDHSKGEDEHTDVIGLPDDLFIRVLDLELQDAVAKGQSADSTALEAVAELNDSSTQPTKWHLEKRLNAPPCLFYDGRIYVPDDLALRRKIVADHHDAPIAGHPGMLATTCAVRLSYWWPGEVLTA